MGAVSGPPSDEDARKRAGNEAIALVSVLNDGPPEAWPLLRIGQGRRDCLDNEAVCVILDAVEAGRIPGSGPRQDRAGEVDVSEDKPRVVVIGDGARLFLLVDGERRDVGRVASLVLNQTEEERRGAIAAWRAQRASRVEHLETFNGPLPITGLSEAEVAKVRKAAEKRARRARRKR